MKSICNTLLSVVPVFALTVNLLPAQAGVLAPGSAYNGKLLAEWSGEWNEYVYSIPEFDGPLWDFTGEKASLNQSGSVFFLVGTFTGESVTRNITVTENQLLFLPLMNIWYNNFPLALNDPPKSGAELASFVDEVIDGTTSLFFNLDGVSLPMDELFQHRETLVSFDVTLPGNNFYGEPAGNSSVAASDGYWLMVEPLSVGKHTINFGGSLNFFDQSFPQDNTYEINVVSVPEPTAIFGLVGLGVGMGISRRKKRF